MTFFDKFFRIQLKDFLSHYRAQKKTFVNKINKYFETTLKETELNSEAELELPPNIDESEIFVNFGV